MFTESSLRQHPAVIKAFMGLPAEAFWALLAQVKEKLPAYEGGLGSSLEFCIFSISLAPWHIPLACVSRRKGLLQDLTPTLH